MSQAPTFALFVSFTILACGGIAPSPTRAIDDGLVGLWNLDETSAHTAARGDFSDTSGDGNDGTSEGDVTFGVAGKMGRAAAFTNGGHVIVGPNAPRPSSAVSASAWIRAAQNVDFYPQIVTMGDATGLTGYNLYVYSPDDQGVASFIVKEGDDAWGSCWAQGTRDVRDGQWHHLVGVYDGKTISIWVDGVQQSSAQCTGQPIDYGQSPLGEIASKASTSTFEGTLDQVAVWNRALAPDDIAALYASGAGEQLP